MAASAFSWVGGLRGQEAEAPPEENAYVYNSEIGVRAAASSPQPSPRSMLPAAPACRPASRALSRRGSLTLTLTLTPTPTLTLTRALRRRGSLTLTLTLTLTPTLTRALRRRGSPAT